jgi:hypothetical protein
MTEAKEVYTIKERFVNELYQWEAKVTRGKYVISRAGGFGANPLTDIEKQAIQDGLMNPHKRRDYDRS